jgi:hypothetical protein
MGWWVAGVEFIIICILYAMFREAYRDSERPSVMAGPEFVSLDRPEMRPYREQAYLEMRDAYNKGVRIDHTMNCPSWGPGTVGRHCRCGAEELAALLTAKEPV